MPLEDEAVDLVDADAEGRGLGEEPLDHGQALRGTGDGPDQEARPVLLHLDVLEGHVEGAGLEQPLHQVVEVFRGEVVEMALDQHHPVGTQPAGEVTRYKPT